jgi:hypothetical protein
MLSDIKYWIADVFFTAELDDAYRLGIKAGTNQSLQTLSFRVSTRQPEMTKTELKGYNKAQDVIESVSIELLDQVGRIDAI